MLKVKYQLKLPFRGKLETRESICRKADISMGRLRYITRTFKKENIDFETNVENEKFWSDRKKEQNRKREVSRQKVMSKKRKNNPIKIKPCKAKCGKDVPLLTPSGRAKSKKVYDASHYCCTACARNDRPKAIKKVARNKEAIMPFKGYQITNNGVDNFLYR